MNTTTARLGVCAVLLGALASGCAGGQTGEEENGSCWSKVTPLGLDAQSPLGFSAQDSLSFAAGDHSATLHWIPPSELPYGPESGDGSVQVTLTSLGSARFATRDSAGATTELDYCPPSVLTDVSVELDSAGGALHESFRAVLAASTKDAASLTATLIGSHLAGSFAFDPAALGDRTLAQVNLNMSFAPSAFGGAIDAGIQQMHGSGDNAAVSLQNVPLACWGTSALGQAGCSE